MKVAQRYKTLLPAVLFVVLYGCGNRQQDNNADAKEGGTVVTLKAIRPLKGSLESKIQIPGELLSYQQVDLYAKVNSFVKKLYVDVGSKVKTGDLLATLEAPEMVSQESSAASRMKAQEARYLASKATYERLLQTSKTPGTVSPNDLEQAFARQQADMAQLEADKASYGEIAYLKDYLQIRAPFSGVITMRNVSPGAYVGPSGKGSEAPIFTLVEQDRLRLVVNLPEAYAGALDRKKAVQFTIPSIPNDSFSVSIARTAGALDDRLRSERVEMDITNGDHKLLPGMVAQVELPLRTDSLALTVPTSAVLNSTLGTFVIRANRGTAEWVPIKAGRSNGERTLVTGAISASDTLVAQATEEIRDGAAIQVDL